VRVIQAAVTGVNGTTDFQVDQESTGGHIARGSATAGDHRIKVRASTLERATEEYGGAIDLLKCGCEGDEYEIIEQITPELAECIRKFTIEAHDLDQRRNLQRISTHLFGLGVSVVLQAGRRGAWRTPPSARKADVLIGHDTYRLH